MSPLFFTLKRKDALSFKHSYELTIYWYELTYHPANKTMQSPQLFLLQERQSIVHQPTPLCHKNEGFCFQVERHSINIISALLVVATGVMNA